jgi:hypothetical protein
MVSGIFTRPRARPPLAAVSSQQNMLAVSTEDELLAALTSLPRSDGACYGRAINIIADITLTRSITLGAQHSGLLITSSSNARLVTSSVLTAAFVVNGDDVTIEKMRLSDGFSATTFARPVGDRASIVGISLDSSSSVLMLVDASGNCKDIIIRGNRAFPLSGNLVGATTGSGSVTRGVISENFDFSGGISSTALIQSNVSANMSFGGWSDAGSSLGSILSMVAGNYLTNSITITNPASGYCSIIGNGMNGAGINTSATFGSNSIVGNTNVGTITNASTDAVTSNT